MSKEERTQLSIITVVRNDRRFIESCLQNVIDQQCPVAEHIIVDGVSTDGTLEIVQQYADRFPHIRWISQKDSGPPEAMNRGISLAKGKIVGFLNSDDFYEPNILNRIIEIFKKLPEPSLAVGNCKMIDEDGKLIQLTKPANLKLINFLLDWNQSLVHPVNPSSYFYHKSLYEKIGGHDPQYIHAVDLLFLLKAIDQAHTHYFDETWGNYRFMEGTLTHEAIRLKQAEEHKEKVRWHFINSLPPLRRKQIIAHRYLKTRLKYYSANPKKLFTAIFNAVQTYGAKRT